MQGNLFSGSFSTGRKQFSLRQSQEECSQTIVVHHGELPESPRHSAVPLFHDPVEYLCGRQLAGCRHAMGVVPVSATSRRRCKPCRIHPGYLALPCRNARGQERTGSADLVFRRLFPYRVIHACPSWAIGPEPELCEGGGACFYLFSPPIPALG